jgi:predicted ATP-grasp superfamily ATP-dependent carboligase
MQSGSTDARHGQMGHRILVTDAGERAVLASLRCLAAGGFEVGAVARTRTAPGLWSRAPRARHLAPDPRVDLDGFLDRVGELVRGGGYDILLAGTDASLFGISRARDRLEPYVRLGLPDHDAVLAALDKQALARAAAKVGLATPEERVCASVEQARQTADLFGYPVAVKPLETVIVAGGRTERRASVTVADEHELRRVASTLGTCIVQRWRHGNVLSVGAVATADGLLAHVVSRYLRMWPSSGGSVCFSETIDAPPGLLERVDALASELQWEGLFELELIASADDRYTSIDFNPRAYGSLGLASAAGVPLSALWCRLLSGERLDRHDPPRAGVRYRWGDADLRWSIEALREGRLRTALGAMRPRRRVTHAYFRCTDPLPLAARTLQQFRSRAGPRTASA